MANRSGRQREQHTLTARWVPSPLIQLPCQPPSHHGRVADDGCGIGLDARGGRGGYVTAGGSGGGGAAGGRLLLPESRGEPVGRAPCPRGCRCCLGAAGRAAGAVRHCLRLHSLLQASC